MVVYERAGTDQAILSLEVYRDGPTDDPPFRSPGASAGPCAGTAPTSRATSRARPGHLVLAWTERPGVNLVASSRGPISERELLAVAERFREAD